MMGSYSHERKHLIFKKQKRQAGKKTDTWRIINGEGQFIGYVVYRAGWRKYITRFPGMKDYLDFDAKCHIQASEFLDEQTAKLRATWKKRKNE